MAGPNGSGKTTLATRVIQPVTHLPFINADVIAAERWPTDTAAHAYEASRAAAELRADRLANRSSFITETVFSHPSKLALVESALEAGFLVHLHVVLLPEDVTVARVAYRERTGGHPVPEDKVRQRYQRLWPLLAQARDLADVTEVYDNSTAKAPLRRVARFEQGQQVGPARWPSWTPKPFRQT